MSAGEPAAAKGRPAALMAALMRSSAQNRLTAVGREAASASNA